MATQTIVLHDKNGKQVIAPSLGDIVEYVEHWEVISGRMVCTGNARRYPAIVHRSQVSEDKFIAVAITIFAGEPVFKADVPHESAWKPLEQPGYWRRIEKTY